MLYVGPYFLRRETDDSPYLGKTAASMVLSFYKSGDERNAPIDGDRIVIANGRGFYFDSSKTVSGTATAPAYASVIPVQK